MTRDQIALGVCRSFLLLRSISCAAQAAATASASGKTVGIAESISSEEIGGERFIQADESNEASCGRAERLAKLIYDGRTSQSIKCDVCNGRRIHAM